MRCSAHGKAAVVVVLIVLIAMSGCSTSATPQPTQPASPQSPTPTFNPLDPCAGNDPHPAAIDSPEGVALANFQTWSQFPARDVRARTLINDGSFARVVICAQMRHGYADVWEEFSGEYGLLFVTGQWTIRDSPLRFGDPFLPVAAAATQQAQQRAYTARLAPIVAAENAIQAHVVSTERRKDTNYGGYNWFAIVELRSTDELQHTIIVAPQFKATHASCDDAAAEYEGASTTAFTVDLPSVNPPRAVGSDPVAFEFQVQAFSALSDWSIDPARHCTQLRDPRDLRLVFKQVDGVSGYDLHSAEKLEPRLTVLPTRAPVSVAEVTPVPTVATPPMTVETGRTSGPSATEVAGGVAVLAASSVACVLWRRRRTAPRRHAALQADPVATGPVGSTAPLAVAQPALSPNPLVTVATSSALYVKCFGGAQVLAGDRVLWPSREFANEQRAWELLFYLAASIPEGVDRDVIGAALWREVDLADVAGSLRQLRRRLRTMLVRAVPGLPEGAPFEADTGRLYRLDRSTVSSDVHAFLDLQSRAKAEPEARTTLLEEAYALYEGDLFDSPASPPFGWAIDPGDDGTTLRQQYRGMFIEMCRTLGDLHARGAEGDHSERAIDLYRRVIQEDPLDERNWRALLKLHSIRGDRAALARDWRRLTEILRTIDPTAAPEVATVKLYNNLIGSE